MHFLRHSPGIPTGSLKEILRKIQMTLLGDPLMNSTGHSLDIHWGLLKTIPENFLWNSLEASRVFLMKFPMEFLRSFSRNSLGNSLGMS